MRSTFELIYDVLIVGGGVIGLTTAVRCAQKQLSVCLLEAGQTGREASWAGAGMIPPGDLSHGSLDYHQLTAQSSQMWAELTAELFEATGIDNGYRVCGSLHPVIEDSCEHEALIWNTKEIECQHLFNADLHSRFRQLSDAWKSALWFPTAAQVRNPWHMQALREFATQLGVTIKTAEPVLDILIQDDQVLAVVTHQQRYSASQYLVTAGAWSPLLAELMESPLPVRPLKGQIVLLKADLPLFDCLIECGKRYLVPREDGRILIGSTEEFADYNKQTSTKAIDDLVEFGISLIPELKEIPIEHHWAGLRPASPDGMPLMGRLGELHNLFVATGHSRAGLTLSPVTADLMTGALLGEPASDLLRAFDANRFENNSLGAAIIS